MVKNLFILATFLVSSFSLMAQWKCETLDPEFDDAIKIAYTQDNKGAQLMIGEYQLLGTNLFGGYFKFSSIGDAAEDYISKSLFFYLYDVYGIDRSDLTENEIEIKSHLLWLDSVSNGPGNIPMILVTDEKHYCEDDNCSVYSFEISFKIGESYKRYKNYNMIERDFPLPEDKIIASYEYDRNQRLGCYNIEWPSKEFWKDFKAASSVKFRIKYNENSDYQYYEFNMSGSTKAFNYVTAYHKVLWLEDWIERLEAWGEKQEEKRFKEQELEDAKRHKGLASIIPPHNLKFECIKRDYRVFYSYYDVHLLPNVLAKTCSSVRDSILSPNGVNYKLEDDNLLKNLGLCPCYSESGEEIMDLQDQKHVQYYLTPTIEGLWLQPNPNMSDSIRDMFVPFADTLVSFDYYFSLYKKEGKRFCGSYGNTTSAWENFDSVLQGYQIEWAQNPSRLFITTNNIKQVFYISDWSFDKNNNSYIVGRDENGDLIIEDKEYYEWTYLIKANDNNDYEIHIWRETLDPNSWQTDIGNQLKLNWYELFSNNIGFKFVGGEEIENKLIIR